MSSCSGITTVIAGTCVSTKHVEKKLARKSYHAASCVVMALSTMVAAFAVARLDYTNHAYYFDDPLT